MHQASASVALCARVLRFLRYSRLMESTLSMLPRHVPSQTRIKGCYNVLQLTPFLTLTRPSCIHPVPSSRWC
jgi:hypothetical protein